MPNAPKTKHRSVRVSDERWQRLGEEADRDGVTRSDLLNEFIAWRIREPGARMPKRPAVE
ncbi:MAG: hypothetical protein ACRD0P_25170 [Stackebrandtia sp.]